MLRCNKICSIPKFAGRLLLVAVALLVFAALPVLAQSGARYPRIPADAKGYQVGMILQDYLRRSAEATPATVSRSATVTRAARPAPEDLTATVSTVSPVAVSTTPKEPMSTVVDIGNPDGSVVKQKTVVQQKVLGPSATMVLIIEPPATGK